MSLYAADLGPSAEPDLDAIAVETDTVDSASDCGNLQISLISPPRTPLHSDEVNLAFYTAIVGKVPQIDPVAGHRLLPPTPLARPQRPWSPIVLSIYLRQAYRQSTLRLHKPEFAAWLRRQSAVARKRLHETHHRLIISSHHKRAA